MNAGPDVSTVVKSLSTADLFVYLIPGTTLFVGILGFETRTLKVNGAWEPHTTVYGALDGSMSVLDGNYVLMAAYVLVLIAAAYVAGHVVSSVSSFAIDRLLVFKAHGYPYRSLLGLGSTSSSPCTFGEAYYRGLFLWLNVYLIVRHGLIHPRFASYQWADNLLGWFLVGLVVWKVASHPVRRYVPPRVLAHFRPLAMGVSRAFCLPYSALVSTWAHIANTSQPLSEELLKQYEIAFKAEFGMDYRSAGTNNYWLPYCHLATNAPPLYKLLIDWLHLYEFARNLSTAFFLAFVYCSASLIYHNRVYSLPWDATTFILPLAYWGMAMIMLARYYYLYASYYSKFLFRSFTYIAHSGATGNTGLGAATNA